jgi:hypothetical protein
VSPGFLPCLWLFATEPTDRALAGWCALPPALTSEQAASVYLLSGARNGTAMFGDGRRVCDP